MAALVPVSGINHLALVVTDLPRSAAFYSDILGFTPLVDLGTRIVFQGANALISLNLPLGPGTPPADNRFDENRVGLDHLSFSVSSYADLENAVRIFDERGITHGEIRDLGEGFRIHVLAFRDPDNTQLELTAPYA